MKKTVLCLALAALLLGACSKKEEAIPEHIGVEAPAAAEKAAEPAPGEAGSAAARSAEHKNQLGSLVLSQQDGERQFIRKADLRFKVKDVYQSALAIEDLVASAGGFVEANKIEAQGYGDERFPQEGNKLLVLSRYRTEGFLQVRVPSARTQQFLRDLAGQIVFLDQRTFTAQDAQFALLRETLAQRRNQQAQQQLADVAEGQGKAGEKTAAITARQDAQADRDEALIAEKEFADQVAFSTITIALYQPVAISKSTEDDLNAIERELQPGFSAKLGEAFGSGWQGLQQFAIVLAMLWPLWGIVLAVALLTYMLARRKHKAAPVPEAAAATPAESGNEPPAAG
ncbi:DUF4349 domain-containing protein [Chitinilyticum aquatile]|uniref:DUF4349 domain-containing protein n=1 Tax=Chitinilyticum aquatile TaxID=362520 RepID=UPI0004064D95|nr:DUF4349 domain-containing protein [Chitinilyticum aquatile]